MSFLLEDTKVRGQGTAKAAACNEGKETRWERTNKPEGCRWGKKGAVRKETFH